MKAFQTTVKEKYYIFEHINAKLEVKIFFPISQPVKIAIYPARNTPQVK